MFDFFQKERMILLTKNKLEITEDELLSDDGIFAVKYNDIYDNAEKCSYCGCAIMPGETGLRLYANGDVIHKQCWQEYADEYTDSFGKEFVCDDGIREDF